MKTILPTPSKPFTTEEITMLRERLLFIEQSLDQGKTVVATRPNQITGRPTDKILRKIEFHPDVDADLVTASGGAMNLLDPSYELAAYLPEEMPTGSEGLCLAHLGSEAGKAMLYALQKPTEPKQ